MKNKLRWKFLVLGMVTLVLIVVCLALRGADARAQSRVQAGQEVFSESTKRFVEHKQRMMGGEFRSMWFTADCVWLGKGSFTWNYLIEIDLQERMVRVSAPIIHVLDDCYVGEGVRFKDCRISGVYVSDFSFRELLGRKRASIPDLRRAIKAYMQDRCRDLPLLSFLR